MIILACLVLPTANGFKIFDLTNSLGLTPIEVGYSHIINETKPLFHFYNLTRLQKEANLIENNINNFNSSKHSLDQRIIDNLYNLNNRLVDELDYLLPSVTRISQTKSKRGLINALGSAISWLTGVPDAEDEEKMNQAINRIKNKQTKLIHEESNDIKFNKKLIGKLNQDLQSINHNNKRVKELMNETLNLFEQLMLVDMIKNNLNQALYFARQLVETVEHCEAHTYHYGVLPNSVIEEMNAKMPLLTTEKRALRALSRVNCIFKENLIIVQVNVPLQVKPDPTYYSVSYPVIINNNTFTIPSKEGLIIRRDDQLYRPRDCETFSEKKFCFSMEKLSDDCLLGILKNQNYSQHCKTIRIPKLAPFARYIPDCGCELSYQRTNISINGHELRVPEVALIHRDPDDVIPEFPKVFLYYDTFPLIKNEVIAPKLKTVVRFEKLKELSFREVDTENITEDGIDLINSATHLNIAHFVIIGLVLLSLAIYIKFKWCTKVNAPTSNNTVLYVPSREAP
jgi:hypothetical protein